MLDSALGPCIFGLFHVPVSSVPRHLFRLARNDRLRRAIIEG